MSLNTLPTHLAERTTVHSPANRPIAAGSFVLYWMRTAVRAHENPALDVAHTVGARLGLPVFVYHALSEQYPYASDRHHTFILEGARDVQAECAARGIGYAFHLERPGHRTKALASLAERAALVVTETFPAPPLDWLTDSLADSAPCPVWSVDTACVVPMPLVGTAHTRAFGYRDATARLRDERVTRSWTDVAPTTGCFVPDALPFEPVDLSTAHLPTLVATCRIDHGVAPVPDTPGGSVAGYARWEQFKHNGRLARYAADRNDPNRHGVSRMSAYLHYGMVSPLRLARECAAMPGDGPEKFLDELLIWRELAYAFCFWHDAPTTLDAVPAWALATLREHERDARPTTTWEALSRGRSGDALWDAAQQSLLRHGELHNNVRMTWGKALVGWSRNADEAWDRLVDLNHRYALDGRDPASYGGLLWCLGQFDRPFTPPVPVLGTVRPRPTRDHAKRLDLTRWQQHVTRARTASSPRVVVIGAGVAGLACARTLQDHGVAVTVLDKSRGVGGRLSTRREGDWRFDHGAPSVVLGDARLVPYVASWEDDRVLRHRDGELVGVPAMNAWPKHLAADLQLRTGFQVASLDRTANGWRVASANGEVIDADMVLLAVPAPQAVALLRSMPGHEGASVQSSLEQVTMSPCWSTMLVFDGPPPTTFGDQLTGGVWVESEGCLARCVRESEKPQRSSVEAWTIQASAAWSAAALERTPDEIAREVEGAFRARSGIVAPLLHAAAHRWRFARVTQGLPTDCLFDATAALGACGDFAWGQENNHADVQAAWLSGVALAARVLA